MIYGLQRDTPAADPRPWVCALELAAPEEPGLPARVSVEWTDRPPSGLDDPKATYLETRHAMTGIDGVAWTAADVHDLAANIPGCGGVCFGDHVEEDPDAAAAARRATAAREARG